MATKSDVKITASGFGGTPVGVTIVSQVGSIPTASVDIAPPGGPKISGGSDALGGIDASKRSEASVSISVKSHIGGKEGSSRTLTFKGLLDGLSLNSSVGGVNYQAVIKNKAQTLLELTTYTPGLSPAGINIYRNPSFSMLTNTDESGSVVSWGKIEKNDGIFNQSPIKAYTGILKWILKQQKGGWKDFIGKDSTIGGNIPFGRIFSDARYGKAVSLGLELLESVDYSMVSGGMLDNIKANNDLIMSSLGDLYRSGPQVLLENYMNFLAYMGCTLIFSNSKLYIVPINSVLKQPIFAPGKGATTSIPNAAGPGDYNSFSYNDNGYRDVAGAVVVIEGLAGGFNLGAPGTDSGGASYYMEDEGASRASGIIAVKAHPFMSLNPYAARGDDAKKLQTIADSSKASRYPGKVASSEAMNIGKDYASAGKQKLSALKSELGEVMDAYAQSVFYQTRYGDRHGSITLDFNPNWAPGTGGTLYIRETGISIHFYVTSVTHRVEMSAPNHGSAITVISFSCGRAGKAPSGITQDKFLGYNVGKEKGVQSSYIGDNK
jgi:hypothetical protein